VSEFLRVEGLVKHFPIKRGIIFQRVTGRVHAVDGINFAINEGETLGLVGESGCGKTTTAKVVTRLIEATNGQVFFKGENIFTCDNRKMRRLRREMQIIFQDPFASLNPRMTVGNIVEEPLLVHKAGNGGMRRKRVKELLDLVGLKPEHAERYPHQFSGGQRQRVGVARALALNPKLVICDEPVSALDVSVQAQIVNLLVRLRKEFGLTYLFIAHDLGVIRHFCDRVAVMYLGKIVELANNEDLYNRPQHPYTQSLLSAVPLPDPIREKERKRIILKGDVPSPVNPPSGCRFHTRCPIAQDICSEIEPKLKEVAKGQLAACHFAKSNPISINYAKINLD